MDAIVRTPLPSMSSEALPNSRAPSLREHYPASSLLRAHPPPSRRRPLSREHRLYGLPCSVDFATGREGFSSCLTCPACRAVAHTPPEQRRGVSQTATVPPAFAP